MWRGSGKGRRRGGIELRDVVWLEFVLIALLPLILKRYLHLFTLLHNTFMSLALRCIIFALSAVPRNLKHPYPLFLWFEFSICWMSSVRCAQPLL
jgi:hypothetical protein